MNGSRTFIGGVQASWGRLDVRVAQKLRIDLLSVRVSYPVLWILAKRRTDNKATDQQCRRRKYVVPLIHEKCRSWQGDDRWKMEYVENVYVY